MHSRSPAELNGCEGSCRTVGVIKQLLDGYTDGHDPDRVRVRLVKHGAQTLDGLSFCQRSLFGVNRLKVKKKKKLKITTLDSNVKRNAE